jgi:hypothetical protein
MAMPPERVHHSISFLTSEVHAMFMFCQMMARFQPDHELTLRRIDEIDQIGLASIGATTVPDATIEGFQFVMEGLRKIVKSEAATR